jgi:Na+/H+ antiporter
MTILGGIIVGQRRWSRRLILGISAVVILLGANPVLAAEAEAQTVGMNLGWWTLLPPALAIILAFTTKDVILSLFIGVFSGAYIMQLGSGVSALTGVAKAFASVVGYFINSLADPWNAGVLLQVMTIGGLIALVAKTGGAMAVAERLSKYAKGPISTQIITWLLGMAIFFDDYANALTIGPIMRPVSDNMGISRERLAFVIDATAAPVTGIALISTWVGYEISLISGALDAIGVEMNAYSFFLDTLPYRFYNIFMLLFVFVTSVTLREFGPMKQAQLRAKRTGDLIHPDSSKAEGATEHEHAEGGTIWNALIPIGALIVFSFIGFYVDGRQTILAEGAAEAIRVMETAPFSFTAIRETFGASDASVVLFQASLLASIIALVMGMTQGRFGITEGIEHWFEGMKSLLSTGGVLLLAWSLSSMMKAMGTADFLVSALQGNIHPLLLPSLIFVFGAVISFATGTSFGTMGILMPLAIPLAEALDPGNMQLVTVVSAAVLAGAIMGDHSSPISDTTILSAMGAGSDLIDHVRTQMPYALTVGAISVALGYIPAAYGISPWVLIPVGFMVLAGIVYFFGQRIDTSVE